MTKLSLRTKSWGSLMATIGIVLVIIAVKDDDILSGLIGGFLFAMGLGWYIEYKIEASKGDSVDE